MIEHPDAVRSARVARTAAAVGVGDKAHLLLGVLPHSSRWRGWVTECEDQPPLIDGLHRVATRLGGLTQRWRFDRMATVCHPGSGRFTASFGPVAMHYQVGISICPSRHAWRKGALEKSAHTLAQRWWRTLGDDVTVAAAQASQDRICIRFDAQADSGRGADHGRRTGRRRADAGDASTVPDGDRDAAHRHQIRRRSPSMATPTPCCPGIPGR